jgi:hypothetical protein
VCTRKSAVITPSGGSRQASIIDFTLSSARGSEAPFDFEVFKGLLLQMTLHPLKAVIVGGLNVAPKGPSRRNTVIQKRLAIGQKGPEGLVFNQLEGYRP